jgi:hypothetical protein
MREPDSRRMRPAVTNERRAQPDEGASAAMPKTLSRPSRIVRRVAASDGYYPRIRSNVA